MVISRRIISISPVSENIGTVIVDLFMDHSSSLTCFFGNRILARIVFLSLSRGIIV